MTTTRRACTIATCERRYKSGGFCAVHLAEARASGTLKDLRFAKNRPPITEVACRIEGCGSASRYRGQRLCIKHYLRRHHTGSFDLPKKPTLSQRLNEGIESREGCWLWGGRTASTGYGVIGRQYAHRVSHEVHKGPIPEGFQVDHLCRVRHCVNPDHLEAVTQEENLRRQREYMSRRDDGTWHRAGEAA